MDDTFLDLCFRCTKKVFRREGVMLSGGVFCPECADLFSKFMHGQDYWPDKAVRGVWSSVDKIDLLTKEFEQTLSNAQDEKPLQKFFEKNPGLLLHFFRYGQGGWVFPQPRFGSEYIPDFAICGINSAGPHWHLVELESPKSPILRKDGQQGANFTHAMRQISDWRIWLRKNNQYAQNELGYVGLDTEFKAAIVMGRRQDLIHNNQEQYRELSLGNIEVMSYDRILEQVFTAARSWQVIWDNLAKPNSEQKAG